MKTVLFIIGIIMALTACGQAPIVKAPITPIEGCAALCKQRTVEVYKDDTIECRCSLKRR